jgi:prolipoprotein diacylglyceryltransferase
MKSFFFTLAVGLIITSFYRVLISHKPFNDQYYMLFIALGCAIGWYITLLIERKKHRQRPK